MEIIFPIHFLPRSPRPCSPPARRLATSSLSFRWPLGTRVSTIHISPWCCCMLAAWWENCRNILFKHWNVFSPPEYVHVVGERRPIEAITFPLDMRSVQRNIILETITVKHLRLLCGKWGKVQRIVQLFQSRLLLFAALKFTWFTGIIINCHLYHNSK